MSDRFDQLRFRYESWRLGRPALSERRTADVKAERVKFRTVIKSFGGSAPRQLSRRQMRQFRKLLAREENLGREWRTNGNQTLRGSPRKTKHAGATYSDRR